MTAALFGISIVCAVNSDEVSPALMMLLSLWIPLIGMLLSPRLHWAIEKIPASMFPQWLPPLMVLMAMLALIIGIPSPLVGLVVGLVGRRDHNRVKFLIGFFLELYGVFVWLFIIRKSPTPAHPHHQQADMAVVQARYADRIAKLRNSRLPEITEGPAAGGGYRGQYSTFSSHENFRMQDHARANPDSVFPTTNFPTTFLQNSVPFSAGTFRGSPFILPYTTVPCTVQSPAPQPTIEENKSNSSDDEENLGSRYFS